MKQATEEQVKRAAKKSSEQLLVFISSLSESRERSLALTKLEECLMWATQAIEAEPVFHKQDREFTYHKFTSGWRLSWEPSKKSQDKDHL